MNHHDPSMPTGSPRAKLRRLGSEVHSGLEATNLRAEVSVRSRFVWQTLPSLDVVVTELREEQQCHMRLGTAAIALSRVACRKAVHLRAVAPCLD